jgi:4-amino-4-deoxy-L-arabinose transferase-like glycosyltransferase
MQADSGHTWLSRHRNLLFLAVAAAAIFTANMHQLSLLPLDDCFYARKGVEMAERGASFTVTWNQHPSYQNPPMQFWVLGASFALFGENDFAARLPSTLMALAILLLTYRIGLVVFGERGAAWAGVGMLLLVPAFVQNARRCMLEIPNTFWIVLCLWLVLESRRRPVLGAAAGLPLAAAGLTKSLLGLLPILVVVGFALHRDGRRLLANPWLLLGLFVGVVGTATWPLHQAHTAGWSAVRAHYANEIGGRALEAFSIRSALTEYPKILLLEFQPVALPGLAGVILALRGMRRAAAGERSFLGLWVLLPLLVYSFASARSARYIFPIVVPLALLAGDVLFRWRQRETRLVTTRIVPGLLLVLAAIFWVRPQTLSRDLNAPFKRAGPDIQRLVPEGSDLPLFDDFFSWRFVNPFVYYGHRGLVPLGDRSLQPVLEVARQLPRPAFVAPRHQLETIRSRGVDVEVYVELGDWLVLLLKEGTRGARLGPPLAPTRYRHPQCGAGAPDRFAARG